MRVRSPPSALIHAQRTTTNVNQHGCNMADTASLDLPLSGVSLPIDNVDACGYSLLMNNNELTTDQMIETIKSMSVEERIAFLKENRPELFDSRIQTVSFGKAPKDGWKDGDKVAK